MTESHDAHLVNTLGALALALSDRIRGATEAAAGMTGAATAALIALHQFLRGRSTEDLAQATGLTHSGAVRLIDRLVEANLVERRAGRDRRSSSIVLTAAGRRLSRRVTVARANAIETVLAGLGDDQRRALLGLVDALVATVTAQRLDARQHGDEPDGWLCRMCDPAACGRPDGTCPAANTAQADTAGAPASPPPSRTS